MFRMSNRMNNSMSSIQNYYVITFRGEFGGIEPELSGDLLDRGAFDRLAQTKDRRQDLLRQVPE